VDFKSDDGFKFHGNQLSVSSVQCSVFSIQYSVFDGRLSVVREAEVRFRRWYSTKFRIPTEGRLAPANRVARPERGAGIFPALDSRNLGIKDRAVGPASLILIVIGAVVIAFIELVLDVFLIQIDP